MAFAGSMSLIPSQTVTGPNFGTQTVSGGSLAITGAGSFGVVKATVTPSQVYAMTATNSTWPVLFTPPTGKFARVISITTSDPGGSSYTGGTSPVYNVYQLSSDLAHIQGNLASNYSSASFGGFGDTTAGTWSYAGNNQGATGVWRNGFLVFGLNSGTTYSGGGTNLNFTIVYYLDT